MKISHEHYQVIVNSLAKLPPDQIEQARREARSHYTIDLQMNFRWRLFVTANLWEVYKMSDNNTDDNIDIALKKAIKELGIAPA